jgi:hypothetical protein
LAVSCREKIYNLSKFGTLKIFVSHFGVVSLSTTRLPVPTMPDTQSSGKKRTLDAAFDDIIGSSDSDDPLAGTGTGGPQATQRSRSQAQAPPKKKRGPGKKNSEPMLNQPNKIVHVVKVQATRAALSRRSKLVPDYITSSNPESVNALKCSL